MPLSLPTFQTVRHRQKAVASNDPNSSESLAGELTPAVDDKHVEPKYKRRKGRVFTSSLLLLIAIIFLILVIIGNTHNAPVLAQTYFIRVDLSAIFLASATPLVGFNLLNSIARSIGLHDFYDVGLWNFCEGYHNEERWCMPTVRGYYFNPVEIITSELLAGATIVLPADILTILDLIKHASHAMFGLFIAGIVLTTLYLIVLPLSLLRTPKRTRRKRTCLVDFSIGIIGFLAVILVAAAAIVATVMFVIMKNVLTSQPELNIGASLGKPMFAFMWVATACVITAWILQCRRGWCCCCRNEKRNQKRIARHREKEQKQGHRPGLLHGFGHRRERHVDDGNS